MNRDAWRYELDQLDPEYSPPPSLEEQEELERLQDQEYERELEFREYLDR